MLSTPLVSAILPAYNSAATIERALRSVVAQTYPAIEIIVVDDASRDGTPDLVRRFPHPINLLELPRNLGPSAARNAGIRLAQGEFVAFLDSDDEWLPEKISKQVASLLTNTRATISACHAVWIYPHAIFSTTLDENPPVSGPDAWRALLEYAFIQTSYVVAKRSAVLDLGGFNENLLVAEDQDLWIRLAMRGELAWVDEELVRIHSVPGSFMKTHAAREAEYLLPMIERHVTERAAELSHEAIRRILGARYSRIGRNLYEAGDLLGGASLIAKSIKLGNAPVSHLAFLVHASPWGKRMKAALRAIRRRIRATEVDTAGKQ